MRWCGVHRQLLSLHSISALHYIPLHFTAIHCTVLQCTVLHNNALPSLIFIVCHCTVLHPLHFTALHYMFFYNSLQWSALYWFCTSLIFISLHCSVSHQTLLRHTVWHYTVVLASPFGQFGPIWWGGKFVQTVLFLVIGKPKLKHVLKLIFNILFFYLKNIYMYIGTTYKTIFQMQSI